MKRRCVGTLAKVRHGCGIGLLGLAAACWAQGAAAVDFSVAAAVGPAQGRIDCIAAQPCDRHGGFGMLEGTGRFDGGLEIGVRYVHAGVFKGRDQNAEAIYGGDFRADAIGLTAGYGWQLGPAWRLTGRAGAAAVHTRFRYDAPFSGTAGKTTLQPLVGLGVTYALSHDLAVGLDYDETRFKVHATHGPLRMPGLSLHWNF